MIEVLYLSNETDRNCYLENLLSVSIRSPYNSIDFFEIFSSGLEDLICVKEVIHGETILLPGYLRGISWVDVYKDFVSPYGYSGPIYCLNVKKEYLELFWQEVEEWFKSNKIISAFIRFSLNGNYCNFPGILKKTMFNIKGIILQSEEEQWQNYDRKVRKNVNRALREGLTVNIVKGEEVTQKQLECFHEVYISTMERTSATDDFFYEIEGFLKFSSSNGKMCAFAFVTDNDIITSVEMVLLSDDTAYSFLGGTLSDHFSNRPNDILKHSLINYFRDIEIKYFVLGGGYGTDDGIFRYKRCFFPNDIVDYITGRWIISLEAYNSVLEKAKMIYEKTNGFSEELDQKDFFPEYRKYLI